MKPYFETSLIQLYQGDCLAVMPTLPDGSVDFILTDLPYGILDECEWDKPLPLDALWEQWKRLLKERGCVALFGTQPFTTDLINSNRKWFKYEWIWEKTGCTNFGNARIQPLRYHENILIFYQKIGTYNPIREPRSEASYERLKGNGRVINASQSGTGITRKDTRIPGTYRHYDPETVLPRSVQKFGSVHNGNGTKFHNCQKPVDLLQYLIRTYTNEGDTVLDCTMGSGSCCVAAQGIGRRAIGIELEPGYCEIAAKRCSQLSIFNEIQEVTV